jgi:uncharacterized protein (DUF362 family)
MNKKFSELFPRNSKEQPEASPEPNTRREFLRRVGWGAAGLALGGAAWNLLPSGARAATSPDARPATGTLTSSTPPPDGPVELAVFKGENPGEICRQAVEALGGMKRFVKKGDVVVVKPNIGWDRTPEQAANTNPEVVAALVAMALDAGASRVKVFDNTCQNQRSCYARSGIQEAATKAGALVIPFSNDRCRTVKVPNGEFLTEWPVFIDALEADCYINCPIAKVHGLTRVTLGMKNVMGAIGGKRGQWHTRCDEAISEFLGVIKPQLTVIDAYRILIANGPSGGSLDDVRMPKLCFASTDPVAIDARAADLFGYKPDQLKFIPLAAARGFGQMDLSKVRTLEKI